MMVSSPAGAHLEVATKTAGGRLPGLDRLRGLAVLLMVADHLLLFAGLNAWRLNVTRASLPLFAFVAGALLSWRGGTRRMARVFVAGVVATVLGQPLGIGQPDVLLLLGAVLYALPAQPLRSSLWWWGLLGAAVIHPTTWGAGLPWTGYQVGTVVALVMVGQLAGAELLDGAGRRLPAVLGWVGRAPLWWYLGHLWVLLVLAAALGRLS